MSAVISHQITYTESKNSTKIVKFWSQFNEKTAMTLYMNGSLIPLYPLWRHVPNQIKLEYDHQDI